MSTGNPIQIESNIDDVIAGLARVASRWPLQLKYALYNTARDCRDAARAQAGRAFKWSGPNTRIWTQRGIVSSKSKDISPHMLEAFIWIGGGSGKKSRAFMAIHERGGRRRSVHSGGLLGVPTKRVKRGARGVSKSQRPGKLIKGMKTRSETRRAGGKHTKFAYFIVERNGQKFIMKRPGGTQRGRRGKKVLKRKATLWYSMKKTTRQSARFGYETAIIKVAGKAMLINISKELANSFTRGWAGNTMRRMV